MNRYIFTAICTALSLIGTALGQEPWEVMGSNKSSTGVSSIDFTSIITVLIFFVTILLIVIISARSYSNTSKVVLEKAFERNRELPEDLQEPVTAIIRAFPQAEPLGLPRGSLRAIVVLIFSFAFVFLLLFPPKQVNEMITTLEIILSILVGFYFGSRYAESRVIRPEPTRRTEEQGIKEVFKEIAPAEVLPEEKREEKKKRKKREELI